MVLNPNKKKTKYEYVIICRKSNNSKMNKVMQPYMHGGRLLEKEAKFPKILDYFGTTSSAKDEIKQIFGDRTFFSTPKPLKLIKEFIRATTDKNSIVLDYFAGSGTTGDACMRLNEEDGGQRKFILVSNNENDICKKVTDVRLKSSLSEQAESYVFLN